MEEGNCLNDDSSNGHETSGYSIKPPANILVLEGDCLDTSGDAGEQESYLVLHPYLCHPVIPFFERSLTKFSFFF